MRNIDRVGVKIFVAGLVLATLSSCADGPIDSGDSADVVMIVSQLTAVPAVTTAFDATTGACLFTVTNVTATINNRPKNGSAADGEPFSSIIMDTVDVSYVWDDPTLPITPTRTFSIGGTAPPNGSVSVSFPPLALDDLNVVYAGHTVTQLNMVFRGHTPTGDQLTAAGNGGALAINSCPVCVDSDTDGICDSDDNCRTIANFDQADSDSDLIGDVCDACPLNPNPLCVAP